MKKIIGIFIMMLLIGTTLPIVSSSYEYVNDDCGCDNYSINDYMFITGELKPQVLVSGAGSEPATS